MGFHHSSSQNLWESLANFVIDAGNQLLERTIIGAIFVVGLLLAEPFAFGQIAHSPLSWGAAILAADISYYWMHRIEHERRFLWAVHAVHHSSPEYNLTTSMRLSWFESLFEWVFFVPMILIGFDVVQTVGGLLIVVIYQTWIHTEKINKMGVLDWILNTPSNHRVHHGRNAIYIDKNYGGILMIWDQIFGTFQRETEPVDYGITVPVNSSNPFVIIFSEFFEIGRDLGRAKNMRDWAGYIFGRPGWAPKTSLEPSPDKKEPSNRRRFSRRR